MPIDDTNDIGGSYTKISEGKYKFRVRKKTINNGKEIVVIGRTKKECREKMRQKLREKNEIIDSNVAAWTLVELCEKHLDYDLNLADKLKPKSIDRRECSIRNQIEIYELGKTQIQAVQFRDIENHIELLLAKGLSVSTVRKAYDVINAAYRWANRQELITINPCTRIHDAIIARLDAVKKKNNAKKSISILSEKEIEQLNHAARLKWQNGKLKSRVGLYALLLLETGMRCGEACALRWRDYSVPNKTLNITFTRGKAIDRNKAATKKTKYKVNEGLVKTDRPRTIALSDRAVAILEEIKKVSPNYNEENYILLNRKNHPTDSHALSHCLNTVYQNAGLDTHNISGAHILRRTCATKMYHAGASVEEIAAYLGDLPETIQRNYINPGIKVMEEGKTVYVIPLPNPKKLNN